MAPRPPLPQPSTPRLYFLDVGISTSELNGRLLTCKPDGSDLRELITQINTMPDGIAIDAARQHIYWTNMGVPSADDGSIQRCDLSGQNIVTIVPKGHTHTPKQLTIAPRSQKLYWSDREGRRVMRANLDGSEVEVLSRAVSSDGTDTPTVYDWCVGIAVDEEAGLVYWTQKGPSKGNQGRIFRMGIERKEGESVERRTDVECLLEGLPEPIDLELDHATGTLYWTDRGDPPRGNTVNAVVLADLAASKQNLEPKILVRKLHEGIGIALDVENQRMFFGDLGGSLYCANLDGSCKSTVLPDIGGAITGVAYVGL
ncbi:YWTD domain-containing protein [Aspergillus japonicus CBS 114.51]|uniref:YWTD domain-containing protein n=1 Tax=Aspergillus japonicus CBS 114.51 TaxID=1448312 RepID=A0A8T8X074_ASPJA|nr:YWTD domain-containing protein [Aspergillus japonicus CBS 114.51]RAH81300.1 YWTD domain-containing protein [Aspergillus japonicus CBS 114.51]